MKSVIPFANIHQNQKSLFPFSFCLSFCPFFLFSPSSPFSFCPSFYHVSCLSCLSCLFYLSYPSYLFCVFSLVLISCACRHWKRTSSKRMRSPSLSLNLRNLMKILFKCNYYKKLNFTHVIYNCKIIYFHFYIN